MDHSRLEVAAEELAMKTHDARHELEIRAAAALKAALAEVSTIKVREIRPQASMSGSDSSLMVYVDLFGQRHALACEIQPDGHLQNLRLALEELRTGAAHRADHALPIIVAPYLSPEAQALCKENKTGFVDLEGNARLALGEVFIVKRTLPHRGHRRPAAAAAWQPAEQKKLPVHIPAARHGAAQHAVA